jgi:hypothetical protein
MLTNGSNGGSRFGLENANKWEILQKLSQNATACEVKNIGGKDYE